MPDTAPAEKPPRGFARFRRRAETEAKDPGRVRALARRAGTKLREHRGSLGDLRDDVPVLLRLVRAWARKDYRAIPWKSLVTVVAGLLYFVAPLDAIPDLIPFAGFVDDAAVIAFVLRAVRADIEAFADWEADEGASNSPALPEPSA